MPNAIILAGSQPAKGWGEAGSKALFRINGKMMIEYVIEALKKTGRIDRIIAAGPGDILEKGLAGIIDGVVDSDGSIMEHIEKAVEILGVEEHILVCSSDIPMITADALRDFIEKSELLNADFCYPIVEKSENEKKFPGIERTYVKVKDGTFTGGNVAYLNPRVLERSSRLAGKLINARKNPVEMARILSFGFMMQLAAGVLPIARIEKRFSELLGIKAKAVVSSYPEIGNDVDKPSDVIIATAHLTE